MRSTWGLAKDNIKCLKPCVHGGKILEAQKQANFTREQIVDFSSSVNPLGASQKALEAIKNSLGQISAYPDSTSAQLREAIAANFKGITADNIVVGNGSTELIYLFAETFVDNREAAIVAAPTFGEYENAVRKAGGELRHINLGQDFRVEADTFISEMRDSKAVFLCNPNNPTSILTPHDTLIEVIEAALEEDVLVFLDEDFLEFVDEEKQESLIEDVNDYANLFVLRSFTKAFGLTGLRVGYGIAAKETIKLLSKAKIPWNVNCIAQTAASAALTDTEHIKKSRELVKTERLFLTRQLKKIKSFKVYPADANFVFVNIKDSGFTAAQLKEKLLQQGILIRDCSSFRGVDEYHIRVAVKTRQENEKLLQALMNVLENNT